MYRTNMDRKTRLALGIMSGRKHIENLSYDDFETLGLNSVDEFSTSELLEIIEEIIFVQLRNPNVKKDPD